MDPWMSEALRVAIGAVTALHGDDNDAVNVVYRSYVGSIEAELGKDQAARCLRLGLTELAVRLLLRLDALGFDPLDELGDLARLSLTAAG